MVPGLASSLPGLIVGLSGGIATGKSTVCGMFRELGAVTLDADEVAHDLLQPGGAGVGAVKAAFGDQLVDASGGIDRSRLGELVFRQAERRAVLESILHPLIAVESERRLVRSIAESGARIAIYDAALLVETGRYRDFDKLIVVTAPAGVQISRLMKEWGLSREEASTRLGAQWPLERKTAVADYVIDAGGKMEGTRRRVSEVFRRLEADADAKERGFESRP